MDNRNNEISIAKDAQLDGRAVDAINVLLESHTLHEALQILTPDRTPRVGDILYRSWGYDQTNINFYRVEAVTSKSVRIVPLASKCARREQYDDYMVPSDVVDPYEINHSPFRGKPATKRFECVRDDHYGVSYRCNFNSYSSLHLWDGKPCRQTGLAYGH